jgi:eukaryotic-like serine/threonine-protein kinase
MIEEGSLIAGRYRLISLIGEGGMASVWRAEDQTLKRQVAVKLLYVRGVRDPQTIVDQFLREARIAASVQHRNVIHTMDFGISEQLPFMVMELLNGESLYDRMHRAPPLAMEEVVHIVCVALRGLAAVHESGIVHRDVKPQNIFLHRDLDTVYPKLLDFGISRSVSGDDRPSAVSTVEGMIVGTPDYMAPEQARGEVDIDKRADIYSMAAIVYEGVTGRLPFMADTVGQLIVEIVTGRAPPMKSVRPDVPSVLSGVIEQAMAHDREQRFIDASAFRRALLAAAERAFVVGSRAATSDAPPPMRSVAAQPAITSGKAAPGSVGSAAPVAWGDFEGLDARSGKPVLQEPKPTAAAALVPASVAAAPVALPPAAAPPAMVGSRAAAPAASQASLGGVDLVGNDPFDSLGGGLTGSGALELELGGSAGPGLGGQGAAHPALAGRAASRRVAQGGSTAAGSRGAPNGRKGVTAAPSRRGPQTREARSGFDPIWVVPVLLGAALLSVLFAPSLLTASAGDDDAAAAQEARNPATSDSTRQWQGLRRHDVGARPPALRDALF